jgi:cholesterol oxidase
MITLSSSLDQLQEHYDAIVVGSGYGGSIAACRLSRAGRKVALLERGREIHPGHFPSALDAAKSQVQTSSHLGADGDPRGLYWFHVGGDMSVFSGCGLGGTSLVNANVALRPDPRVLEHERWPKTLRDDPEGLEAGYARAEHMLTPKCYPASYPPLAKMDVLRRAADSVSLPWSPTPINVTFTAGPNAAGVHQDACTGCGDCVTGCNVGAKNTLLMNYLPDAHAHGAAIFTEVEVRWVEREPGGAQRWVVRAQPLGVGRDSFEAPPLAVTADLVVLSAGVLGSTGILLRSRQHGLELSDQLGRHFSGNGDVLAFSFRKGTDVGSIGAGDRRPDPEHPAGPCITSVADGRADRPLEEGVIVEDAVVPGTIAGFLPVELVGQAFPDWLRRRLRGGGPLAALRSLFTHGRKGMTAHLETLLVMGNDDGEGTLVLDHDQVRVQWSGVGTSSYYERANSAVGALASTDGGTFMFDPVWSKYLGHDLITVHPLGGCAMAERAEDGVVDDLGRVFAGTSGEAVHDGLVVWDGSIVPRSLGVNPLFTISALTERAVAGLARLSGWTIDESAPALAPSEETQEASATPPERPGIRFTERMTGYWAPDVTENAGDLAVYERAAEAGRQQGGTLSFELTIASDDLGAATDDLSRPMTATGTVEAPRISAEPLTVADGSFRLLVADDEADTSVRHMHYELPMASSDGRRMHFSGFKVVAPGDAAELWPATTTLYVTLHDGGADGPVLGRGVLRIEPRDFARQLRTMRVTGPVSLGERLRLEADFGKAFAGPLFEDFGTVVERTTRFDRAAPLRRHRALDLPPRQVVPFRSKDGVPLRLTRYRGGSRGPVLLVHGMGANPLTYNLDTVEQNLVEHLVHQGFDVWLEEWRASTLLPSALTQFTADTVATMDHPPALDAVRAETGRSDVHVVAHCVGSLTWMMTALAGSAEPSSLLCSSVALHPIGPRLTRLKVGLHLGEFLRHAGTRMLTSDSYTTESKGAAAFDLALRLYPIPKVERCHYAVCRRLAFIYGVAVHDPNMDDLTHATMHELFGPTDMTMMLHLSRMARAKQLLGADGEDCYLPEVARLQMPITLLSGSENLVWIPESTARSYEVLTAVHGRDSIRREVIDGYGHQDVFIGARASADAFPVIVAHLDRVNA